jgi:uncharacterized DUF497 family protein
MKSARFDWDDSKDIQNQRKLNVAFGLAQHAFLDPKRVILQDVGHSHTEELHYCIGQVADGIVTVRFTLREGVIRIYGAGYWRKGKKIYEEANRLQR